MAGSSADRDRNDWGDAVIRWGLAFAVFLLLGGITIAVLFWITSSFESASESFRAGLEKSDDIDTAVRTSLNEARGHLLNCTVFSFLGGWVASMIFLTSAQLYYPRTDDEAAGRRGIWWLMLVVTCLLSLVFWWSTVSEKQVGAVLVYANYVKALATGFVCLLLAYYLATAMVVKRSVKWSVPGARALPSLRS